MKLKSRWLQDITWKEAEEYLQEKNIAIVPVGATEQHGHAAAMGLDTYNAMHLAEDVAEQTDVLITPPLWFGDSSHHTAFPGTISLRSETMIAVVKDILRSLIKHDFSKILIINGHKMSNLPALNIAAKDIHEYESPHTLISIADPWKIARGVAKQLKGETVEHHAGVLEVSQLLHKRPDLIRNKNLADESVDYKEIFSEWGLYDLFGQPMNDQGDGIDIVWNSEEQRHIVPTGQFSENSEASDETGKKYHEYMVNVLVKFVQWLQDYEGPIGNTKGT
jgi:creatinine amidohydrolase